MSNHPQHSVRFHAVIIGVGTQDDSRIPSVARAVRDALAAWRFLVGSRWVRPEDAVVLASTTSHASANLDVPTLPPTRSRIRWAFEKWLPARFSEGDGAVVHFVGAARGVDLEGICVPYLVAEDADLDRLAETAVDATWVAAVLRELPAEDIVFACDAVYPGPADAGLFSRLPLGPHGTFLRDAKSGLDGPTGKRRKSEGLTFKALRGLARGGNDWHQASTRTWFEGWGHEGSSAFRFDNAVERGLLPNFYNAVERGLLPHARLSSRGRFSLVPRNPHRLSAVRSLAWPTAQGDVVAVLDGGVVRSDLRGGTFQIVSPEQGTRLECLDADSAWALFAARDGKRRIARNLLTGQRLVHEADLPHRAVLLPEGRGVLMHRGTSLVRWDLQAGDVRTIDRLRECNGLAASRDGRTVAALADKGRVVAWDLESGTAVRLKGQQVYSVSVCLSDDGRWVAGAGSHRGGQGWTHLQIWDAKTGETVKRLVVDGWDEKPGLQGGVGFSPDRRFLCDGGGDAEPGLRIWDTRTWRQATLVEEGADGGDPWFQIGDVRRWKPDDHLGAAGDGGGSWFGYSRDSRFLLETPDDFRICFHQSRTHRLVATLAFLQGGREWMAWTPDGRFDCSPGAEMELEWRCGDRILPFGALAPVMRLEGLVSGLLAGRRPPGPTFPPPALPEWESMEGQGTPSGVRNPAEAVRPFHGLATCPRRGDGALDSRGHGGIVAFAPPSRVLVASGATVEIWDLAQGTRVLSALLGSYSSDGNWIIAAALSADGNLFAVATADLDLRIHRANDGSCLGRFSTSSRVFSLSFRPDGYYLALGMATGHVSLFHVKGLCEKAPGESLETMVRLHRPVENLPTEAAFVGMNGLVTLWDDILRGWRSQEAGWENVISYSVPSDVRWDLASPSLTVFNGDSLSCGSAVWRPSSCLPAFENTEAFTLAPDGVTVARGNGWGALEVRLPAGRASMLCSGHASPGDAGASSWVRPVTFCDPNRPVTLEGCGPAWSVATWNVAERRRSSTVGAPEQHVADVPEKPDGNEPPSSVFTMVGLWPGGSLMAIGHRPDGEDDSQYVALFDAGPWGGLVSYETIETVPSCLAVAPNGASILVGSEGRVLVKRCFRSDPFSRWQAHDGDLLHIAPSHDGQRILTMGSDHAVRVWSLPGSEPLWETSFPHAWSRWGNRRGAVVADLLPDGKSAVVADQGGAIVLHFMDAGGGAARTLLEVGDSGAPLLAVGANGGLVAAYAGAGPLRTWRTATLEQTLIPPPEETFRPTALSLSGDEKRLACAYRGHAGPHGGCSLAAWRLDTRALLFSTTLPEEPLALTFTPDGRILMVVCQTHILLLDAAHGGLLATIVPIAFHPTDGRGPMLAFTPKGLVDACPYRCQPRTRRVEGGLPLQGLLQGYVVPGVLGRILAGDRFP